MGLYGKDRDGHIGRLQRPRGYRGGLLPPRTVVCASLPAAHPGPQVGGAAAAAQPFQGDDTVRLAGHAGAAGGVPPEGAGAGADGGECVFEGEPREVPGREWRG